jgi:hypothetical protein
MRSQVTPPPLALEQKFLQMPLQLGEPEAMVLSEEEGGAL